MATKRTLNLLPGVFQSDTNRKFLSATLDQLVSEPDFVRVDGFIGRKFAPTYKTIDRYINEPSTDRQNYQLEPSVIVKNDNGEIDFYSNYLDLINKIGFYGGITRNHNRLFSNEYYTFNGLFDQDKFVNYQQYFWLPNGPMPIEINSKFVESQKTFTFINDNTDNCLKVNDRSDNNPELIVSRGGLYKFSVNQPGRKIYIQTEPGISGVKVVAPNLSTRDIYGITNNGIDVGIIEFRVPLIDTQDVYLKMPYGPIVDFAIDNTFSEVDGVNWNDIVSLLKGFDGVTNLPIEKTIIFTNLSNSDIDWTNSRGEIVDEALRRGVFKIQISKDTNGNDLINLNYIGVINYNTRINVRLGNVSANKEYYLNSLNQFVQIPALTAQIDTLYYQDSTDSTRFGKIKLVNNAFDEINVDTSIIGKKNYTSPAGIDFTNGMIVSFDNTIKPTKYANKKFVVEGVGKSIRLVDFADLTFPEVGLNVKEIEWDLLNFDQNKFGEQYQGPILPDYIVMNRSSLDLNAWSRQNRWFHIDVINKSAEINNKVPMFNQAIRAQRPIIEFIEDIQLFNNGKIGKKPVDHIDTTHTNAFLQVQNRPTLTDNGVTLKKGQRILFANDLDPLVRTQVYIVQFVNQSQQSAESIYDGKGTGTITINSPTVEFLSLENPIQISGPNLLGEYSWKWKVQGPSKLATAVRITGLDDPLGIGDGKILSVLPVNRLEYEITFTTPFEFQNFDVDKIDIIAPAGSISVKGNNTKFIDELVIGTELYAANDTYLGTVSGVMKNNRAQLEMPSTMPVESVKFWYKKPRVQLKISDDPDDALLLHDTLVAKDGMNKGKTFWYNGTNWVLAQLKNGVNTPILFDVFDNNEQSLSTYNQSSFRGTKIFSYKVGTGAKDLVLGFPLSYTSNFSVADITFYHDFSNDTFQYRTSNKNNSQKIEIGYIKQNIDRYNFKKQNTWATVNEPSQQYQIISYEYTGDTNYFEIDITGQNVAFTPTIKVFLNNNLIDSTVYRPYVKVNKRTAVLISADVLKVGDKIDILILSAETSNIGYYQIPPNLDYNSKNESFENITLGQLRNNLGVIGQGLLDVVGNVPGNSNLRDIDTSNYNGNILQNSAPLIYANLFLINNVTNFVDSIEYARKEYIKFKNKFLELCGSIKGLDLNNAQTSVDKILLTINNVKNKTFPWYYSDMVPFGQCQNLKYTVLDTTQKQFRIQTLFDDQKIQNRAVLVYLNNQQLVKDTDYSFDKLSPSIILAESLITVVGDVLTIKDYITDANFIPETPTKLGLYPKFIPQIFNDDTYREPIDVIQGHDGSLTPCFNDFRDYFLLELEKRIYNNIKEDPIKKSTDIRTLIPGRFRTTEYSLNEYNAILNTGFLKWVGSNKLNFSANSYYVSGDPFTYNYKQTKDSLFNDFLPGYWRGIYQYFYDTDKPHSHPWEMLGFSNQPDWWTAEYGPNPYTKDNALLWEDLEAGIIRHGPRMGIDKMYARPGLSKIIPVDSMGNLLPPLVHIATPLNTYTVEQSFAIGDVGPVEAAWRRTSDFPFSLQIAAALMKPAVYFSTLIDINNYYWHDFYKQYLCEQTKTRISPNLILIPGENVNGTISKTKGYINWIVDYITSTGIVGPTKLRSILNNLEVQLSYKVGGFVDKNFLTVLAEQYSPSSTNESVIIPDDSYKIQLNKSVPIDRISYSAVIIEKTNTGYSVTGYNLNKPYFIVVPSETSGDKYTINVDGVNAIIYKSFLKEKIIFPYGTEFSTKQQVVDFLVSYQRALIAQGFIFNEYDSDLLQVRDWILSVREFITWTMQGWKSGSVIILSPVNNILTVNTVDSVVDQITNITSGSKLLDPNFNVIKTNEISVLRDSGDFKVTSIAGKTIAFAELNLVQFEHVLIFENTTIFNDIIYKPETGSRQFRLKLVGNRTNGWNGSLNAPGFVYHDGIIHEWKSGRDYLKGDLVVYKNLYYVATQKISASNTFDFNYWKQIPSTDIKKGLLSNFSNNANKFIDFYDVDSSIVDSQSKKMRSGLIGFRDRSYLTDLNLNQVSQTKFYQGLIKNKGTGQAITNLKNATFNNLNNDVEFSELWAMRVGEYGALLSNSFVEIIVSENFNKRNPLGICIDDSYSEEGIITVKNKDLYNRSFDSNPVRFINRLPNQTLDTDIQTAGYVNTNDVDAMLFDITTYQDLNVIVDNIVTGFLLWVAKDYKKDWDIYRATETKTQIEKIEYNLDNIAKVFTKDPHKLVEKQLIVVKKFDSLINGFYIINSVTGLRDFTITLSTSQSQILKKKSIISNGQLFSMNSVRFENPADIDTFTPQYGWRDNDLVWIDKGNDNKWEVIKKYNNWNFNTNLPIEIFEGRTNINYGASVKLSKNFVVASAPGDRNGVGQIYVFDRVTLNQLNNLNPSLYEDKIKSLGKSIDFNDEILVAGAPDSSNQKGLVVIYRFQDSNEAVLIPTQVIEEIQAPPGSKFGFSVSLSNDNKWLYVGAPGNDTVYVYALIEKEPAYNSFAITGFDYGCELPYDVTDIRELEIYYQDLLFKPNHDYYLENNTIKFNNIPTNPIGRILITRRSFYDFKRTIVGEVSSEFGYSVKTNNNGSLVFVGAPGTAITSLTDSILQAGAAHLYSNNLNLNSTVLTLTPNKFKMSYTNYKARFGDSIDFAQSTGSVYFGVPGYSTNVYSGGAVVRYVYMPAENQYTLAQEILKPTNLASENFGSFVKVLGLDNKLAVSSTFGTSKTTSLIDKRQTTFDSGSTIFLDITTGTGAVYLYDYMPGGPDNKLYGNYIFGTEFNGPNLKSGDQFGCSLDFDSHEMFIGASYNDTYKENIGAVYKHTNVTGAPVWSIFRKQPSIVDPTSINSISLYNKNTQTKIVSLDYIDPVKGKFLGIVEQNLHYKTSRDPASYNSGSMNNTADFVNLHWGTQQIGQTWWDLNTVRYINYEQEELIYRLNSWGNLFPGSVISVYEWVESNLTPLQYVANGEPGIPLYPNNEKYVTISYADSGSGNIITKYYFWVKGLTTVDLIGNRVLSSQGIKNAIENPRIQSIPYAAVMSDNSIGLFNCDKYLTGDSVVLKIDYDTVPNSNLIHSEFELIQEKNLNSKIPQKLIDKLIDSLAGADAMMRKVPDIWLSPSRMLGLETRPRQTLIIDRLKALKNLANFSNAMFKPIVASNKLQNSAKFKNSLWFSKDAKPVKYDHIALNLTELSYIKKVPGQTILVENDENHYGFWTLHLVKPDLSLKLISNQSFNTQDLWSYKNWYKPGYDESIIPNYVVDYYGEIKKIVIAPGDIVKVNKSSLGGFEIYQFTTTTDSELLAVENGTLEIHENIWDKPLIDGGFDTMAFESTIFDKDQSAETRNLVLGLFNEIFIEDLLENQNKLIFNLIRYILTEQKNVDWIFKTSFISVLHKIKTLAQYPNYIRDNHNYYKEYIDEIKPYSTKVHEYQVSYSSLDIANTAVSDFDLPGYFDRDLNKFRSPNGDFPTKDGILFTQSEYIDWANNFSFEVESISINTGGTGYTKDLQVKIIANGDAGTGATAIAVINELTGAVTRVEVTNPGYGYRNTPYVFISGTGIGATVYARLTNKKIRSIKTILKFDRVAYDTTVREWQPNVVYAANSIVSYQGRGYKSKFTNSSPIFILGNFVTLRGDDYTNANDRLAATYYPGPTQIQKDINNNGNIDVTRLIPGTTYESNTVQSFTEVFNETKLLGPKAYDVTTGTGPFDINVKGGKFFDPAIHHAPEELVAGTTSDSLNIRVSTKIKNPYNPTEQKIVKYRIFKDANDEPVYTAISAAGTVKLAQDLHYNDTKIYLTDISAIAVPHTTARIPGIIFINGEKIKFWRIDVENNAILHPNRGVDSTGVPQVHLANSIVEDQSQSYVLPNTTTVDWDQHIFTKDAPVFKPFFRVHPDLRVTGTRLKVFNSATLLTEGVDYTLSLSEFGGVFITFTQAEFIVDGVKFDASYTTERSWLNVGTNSPADGTGLDGSDTPAANFIKSFVHDLPR